MAVNLPIEADGPSGTFAPMQVELAADLLLLLRLALNDGEADASALAVLRRVATTALGIDASSFDTLLPPIMAYGAEDAAGAGAVFRARPRDERMLLARTLLAAALQDDALKAREMRLRARLAAVLDLEKGDVA